MKKFWIQLLAAAVFALATCSAALAADLSVTVAPDYASAITAAASGSDRIALTYEGAETGQQYLVTAQADGGTVAAPTEDNLVYIDQSAAADGKVSFTLYPKELTEGTVYSVYLSSNASSGITSYTQVATYGLGITAEGDLGDVNGDGDITIDDAVMILENIVGTTELTAAQTAAADVNRDSSVTIDDAVMVLEYIVGNRTSFDS